MDDYFKLTYNLEFNNNEDKSIRPTKEELINDSQSMVNLKKKKIRKKVNDGKNANQFAYDSKNKESTQFMPINNKYNENESNQNGNFEINNINIKKEEAKNDVKAEPKKEIKKEEKKEVKKEEKKMIILKYLINPVKKVKDRI